MADLWRRYVDSLTGVTELTRERAEKLVRELQERGEVRARDLTKAAQELVDRSVRNRRELIRLIRKEIRQQISSIGVATRDDIDKLSRRVAALERSSGKKKTSTRKPAAKKKTAGAKKKSSAPKKPS